MLEVGDSETVYTNPWFSVASTEVRVSDRGYRYYWVEKGDSSLVVPRTRDNGTWVMINSERPTFPGERSLEFPQGGIDASERPEDAAERELLEETGYRALSLTKLGTLQEAAGFATSRIHLFLAEVEQSVEPSPEPLEIANQVMEMTFPEIRSALDAGRIVDAATVAALAMNDFSDV
jgi:ADP-ribose pyrophosphatase